MNVPRTPETIGSLGADIRIFDLAMRADGKSAKTRRTYCEAAIWLAQKTSGIVPLVSWSDITRNHIREHMAWLASAYSPAYCSNQFRSLQAWFRWLSEEEGIPNPMDGLKPPKVPAKLVPVLDDGELPKLLATCTSRNFNDLRDRAIILMFASSGARLAEISGLKVIDLDLDGSAAIVKGKAEKMRIVRYSPEASVALSRYLKARSKVGSETTSLWIGKFGPLTATGVYQMFVRRGRRAGVRINPHRLRHNFSHQWLSKGGAESDLMELNGWSSASMVRRYGASAASERARSHYDKVMAG